MSTDTLFLIAGEPSGDALGASLMRGLKAQHFPVENITGIGGTLMAEQGLETIHPMDELCVMGLWEVVGQLPRLIRLINGVVEEIENRQPSVVVTIDLPDFNFKVAQRLKKRGTFEGKIVHYVAPSVWAWRPGRAKKVARYLDGMMCLFPFEPPYFEKHGLRASYVGHPLIEMDTAQINGQSFKDAQGIDNDKTCIGVFLGSREGEVQKHAKTYFDVIQVLHEQGQAFELIIPTLPNLEYIIRDYLREYDFEAFVVTNNDRKWDTFAACDIAMAVSGTVGLELAYMGIPHITGYKAHAVTGAVVKYAAKVKYAHLTNILLDEEIVPEFLQTNCTVDKLTRALLRLKLNPDVQEKQKAGFKRMDSILKPEGAFAPPSQLAADFVFDAQNDYPETDAL